MPEKPGSGKHLLGEEGRTAWAEGQGEPVPEGLEGPGGHLAFCAGARVGHRGSTAAIFVGKSLAASSEGQVHVEYGFCAKPAAIWGLRVPSGKPQPL